MSPSNTSFTTAWEAVKRHAKEHHRSVNAAYSAYYGSAVPAPAVPAASSAAITTAAGPSAAAGTSSAPRRSSVDKAWSKVKKHAKEHHQSVNAAYTTYYGVNTPRTQSPASSAETSPRVSVDRQ